MKILITSYGFLPQIGGIETISSLLANELVKKSCEVKILTETEENGNNTYPYEVIRKPKLIEIIKAIIWSDIVFQNNLSLRYIWVNLFIRKPAVVTFQIWIDGKNKLLNLLKILLAKTFDEKLVISKSLQKQLPFRTYLINNPFDNELFKTGNKERDPKTLLFVGRLESCKGCQTLIKALQILNKKNDKYKLFIIGDGKFRNKLEELAKELKVSKYVFFKGACTQLEIAEFMQRINIFVVPSLWEEPFGIVALEGMAAGCKVLGTNIGGLKEAIGECGILFEKNDSSHLSKIILDLNKENNYYISREKINSHIKNFFKEKVCKDYLRVFKKVLKT